MQNISILSKLLLETYIVLDSIVFHPIVKNLDNLSTVCMKNGMLHQSNTKHMILAAIFKLGIDKTIDT